MTEIRTEWNFKSFDELSAAELYEILALRSKVFIVEQNCAYQDCDHKDLKGHHLWANLNGETIACARILPPGISYAEPSIGRVVTAGSVRSKNYGRTLMKLAMETVHTLYGTTKCRISAQMYLKRFYEEFGFEQQGEPYLEDDIPHIEMLAEIAKPY